MYQQAIKSRRSERMSQTASKKQSEHEKSLSFQNLTFLVSLALSSSKNEEKRTHVFYRKLVVVTEDCNSDWARSVQTQDMF